MKHIDIAFPTPAMNLACDEALLELCENSGGEEIIRFWEPARPFVVVGYSNSVGIEVNLDECRRDGIPILRRISGGGAVLQGPGCLNYSLILRIERSQHLGTIAGTNSSIMSTHRETAQQLLEAPVEIQGRTDLTIRGRKFSGNSQRRKERCILFHGTFLLRFDIPMVGRYLPMPSVQPEYRARRSHGEFLTNINLSSSAVKHALRMSWGATEILDYLPVEHIKERARSKYETDEWTLRR